MQRRSMIMGGLAALGVLAAGGAWAWRRHSKQLPLLPDQAPMADFLQAYHAVLPAPAGPLRVYHLGHSLTGRDMPLFLAQMAGHSHHSQLGWGASLREHWEPDQIVKGFDAENAHPHFRPVREALASGEYDAVVLTEMAAVEASLKWHVTPHYLALWAKAAREGNPNTRVYLYQSWRELNDPGGWEAMTRADLPAYWEDQFLRRAYRAGSGPVHLIPGGAVLVTAALAAEAGEIAGVSTRAEFFGLNPDGTPDQIHMGDLGNWLIALTHYVVLYQSLPVDIPPRLTRAEGGFYEIPPETARDLSAVVLRVVAQTPGTGAAL